MAAVTPALSQYRVCMEVHRMDKTSKASMTVAVGVPINLALFVALQQSSAPEWALWTMVALTVPYAVLATVLIVDRVRGSQHG